MAGATAVTAPQGTRPFVFTLMPFSSDFDDIYHLGIKAACDDCNAYCERADEQIYLENILERLYNQIAKADLIIADMTGHNANVFYEVGYAHALQRKVILLTKFERDIPFDLKHYPHVIYGSSIVKLKEDLRRRIDSVLSEKSAALPDPLSQVEFWLNGIYLKDKLIINGDTHIDDEMIRDETFEEIGHNFYRKSGRKLYCTSEQRLIIDIRNASSRLLSFDQSISMLCVYLTSSIFLNFRSPNSQRLPDGRVRCQLSLPKNIFPSEWYRTECTVGYSQHYDDKPIDTELNIVLFLENDKYEISFSLKFAFHK